MKTGKVVLISVVSTLATIGIIIGAFLFVESIGRATVSSKVPTKLVGKWKYKSSNYLEYLENEKEYSGIGEEYLEHAKERAKEEFLKAITDSFYGIIKVGKRESKMIEGKGTGDWHIYYEDKTLIVLYPNHIFETKGFGMVCFNENNNELKQVKCSESLMQNANKMSDSSEFVEVAMYDITYEKAEE